MMIAREQTASTSSRMCVEKMIAFFSPISPDQGSHLVFLVRIEAIGRLVEDQHLGIVNDRLRKTGAMPVAFRERLDALMQHGFEKTHLDHAIDRRAFSRSPRNPRSSAAKFRKPRTVMSL